MRNEINEKPKVIIQMSCYNHEKFVGEAVESILNQTYPNWELYVVNDGSTDRTGSILESYQDERIHYYDFKENTRFIGASNFLQKITKDLDADYVASMASDDKWELDKLEKQINFLLNHPEYRACFTWDKIIFNTEDKGRFSDEKMQMYSHKKNGSRFEWLNEFFCHGNCLNANSMLMEKEIFYEMGRMNQNYIQLADFRLWFRFVSRYPFYLMEEELTYYRRHESNLSNLSSENFMRMANESYIIYRDIIVPMDKHTFRRAFYRHLSYVECNSKEELLAEKFMVLMNLQISCFQQAAMDIYFNFCENEEFTSILEKKYGFGPHEFVDMTGSSGLAFFINELNEEKPTPKNQIKSFSPIVTLLNLIDIKELNASTLSGLSFNTIFDLYEAASSYEGGEKQYVRIKGLVDDLRRKMHSGLEKKRILYMVARKSDWDINKITEVSENYTECFVAYVSDKEEIFHGQRSQESKRTLPENVKQIELYNEKEHCLYFLNEVSQEVDMICYVDCLDSGYECGEMIAGYSLGIENRCILKKEIYDDISVSDKKVLSMMDKIDIYQ